MPTQKRLYHKMPRNVEPLPKYPCECTSVPNLSLSLTVVQHPGEQIDLSNNSQGLHGATGVLFSHDSSTVPLEEAVENAERGVHGDLDESTAARQLGTHLGEITGISDDLGDLGEVEHDFGDGAGAGGAAVSQAA